MTTASRALVGAVFAVLGAVAGSAVPALVRRLPTGAVESSEVDGALEADRLLETAGPHRPQHAPEIIPTDFVALAAARHLGRWCTLVGAVVFGMLGLFAPSLALPSALVVAVAAVPLAYVDLREHLLPERIVWPTAAVVLVVLVVQAAMLSRWGALLTALVVAVACFVAFLLLALLAGGGFGFGDVQLVTVLALSAAWVSVGTAVLAVVLAILVGGVVSVLLLAFRRITRRQAVAFGPFLLLGWWGALLLTSSIAPTT